MFLILQPPDGDGERLLRLGVRAMLHTFAIQDASMPQADLISKLFELNYGALFRNLEGITHAESLIPPIPAGNCINWVLGHIVASRNRALALVGVEPIWPRDLAQRYSGRDDADWTPETAVDLKAIAADLARSQQALMHALDNMTGRALAARHDGKSLGELLGFFQFHEAYHTGQIGILRRVIGKAGVIRSPQSRPMLLE
jgi:uncharacterized damage-inducible protein DinB